MFASWYIANKAEGILSNSAVSSKFPFCTDFSLERPKISTTRGIKSKRVAQSWHRQQKTVNKQKSDKEDDPSLKRSDRRDGPQAGH